MNASCWQSALLVAALLASAAGCSTSKSRAGHAITNGAAGRSASAVGSAGAAAAGNATSLPHAGGGGVGGSAPQSAGAGGRAGVTASNSAGVNGSSGALAGSGGNGGDSSAGNAASVGGGAGTTIVDSPPIALSALAANATIGLDWSRIDGATGYIVYWSTTPGVTPQNGQPIDVTEPAYVHRGLSNGTSYYYTVVAVLAGGQGPPAPQVSASPGGEWALETLGTGDFDDVLTGNRVPRIPLAQRVHVLLFPEGYLASELPAFHDESSHALGNNDVDRWRSEVLALDPFSRFKEALVVWYLPRASNAHVSGDSAFHVVVSKSSVSDVSGAAQPLWSAIDGQGIDAFAFAPGSATPINLIAAFLIFDAQQARAAYAGQTATLRNPADPSQSIPAAFGLGHANEFTRAFSNLSDESADTSATTPPPRSETSNISPSNRCDDLPWAHLLLGRGIMPMFGQVGAFGTSAQGYHPELRCQLNGVRDNGHAYCPPSDPHYSTLNLRSNHLCNFCREMTAFRLFEHAGILRGSSSFEMWKSTYRMPFYQRFGYIGLSQLEPGTVSCSTNTSLSEFQDCVP